MLTDHFLFFIEAYKDFIYIEQLWTPFKSIFLRVYELGIRCQIYMLNIIIKILVNFRRENLVRNAYEHKVHKTNFIKSTIFTYISVELKVHQHNDFKYIMV